MTGRVDDLRLDRKLTRSALKLLEGVARYSLLAEDAMVAARLGHDVRAREVLARLPDEQLLRVENLPNLVLTHARLGDFERAHSVLSMLADPPPGIKPLEPAVLEELTGRVARAERALEAGGNRSARSRSGSARHRHG